MCAWLGNYLFKKILSGKHAALSLFKKEKKKHTHTMEVDFVILAADSAEVKTCQGCAVASAQTDRWEDSAQIRSASFSKGCGACFGNNGGNKEGGRCGSREGRRRSGVERGWH